MPAKLIWTDARDAELIALRAAGHSWDKIAAVLGISRNAGIERAATIGARGDVRHYGGAGEVERPRVAATPERRLTIEALPAGHLKMWGFLLSLTPSLGDAAYVPPEPIHGPARRSP